VFPKRACDWTEGTYPARAHQPIHYGENGHDDGRPEQNAAENFAQDTQGGLQAGHARKVSGRRDRLKVRCRGGGFR
jgi:hypothetical protein